MSRRVATALRRYFEEVDDFISSSMVQAVGGTPPYEVTLTQNLINRIADPNASERRRLDPILLAEHIVPDFLVTDMQSTEPVHGADLLIRLEVKVPHFHVDKGILCQAKRHKDKKYGDMLQDHGVDEAKRMLHLTPASFFLLFHGPHSEIRPGRLSAAQYQLAVGIQITPATSVVGMFQRSPDFELAVTAYSTGFPAFMEEDFLQCKVGHPFGQLGNSIMDSLLRPEDHHRPRYVLHLRFTS